MNPGQADQMISDLNAHLSDPIPSEINLNSIDIDEGHC